MAGARTLVARFSGDTTQLEAATKRAEKALGGVSKGAEKESGKFKKAFAGIAAGFAGAAIGAAIKESIAAASDLNEATSKTQQVFGDASAAVIKFADTTAAKMGLSKQSALDAAGTFGIFGKSAGLQGKQLSDFTTKFTGLAADLASFNNTSPEQAIEAIGAALRGESEPMRAYGVLLDDASMRQEALRLGLINTTKQALTPQQKVLAAQSLIYKQTADAQGDFARTSGGLANQQRILTAQFADAKAEIGTALLPIALEFFGFLNKTAVPVLKSMAQFFADNKKVIGPLVVVLAGLAGAVYAVNTATKIWEATTAAQTTLMGLFTRETVAATVATEEQAAASATAGKSMGRLGKVAGAMAGAFIGLEVGAQGIKAIQRATDDAIPGLEQIKSGLLDVGKTGNVKKLGKDFNDLDDTLDRVFNKSRGQSITDSLQTPFKGLVGESGSLRQAHADLQALDDALASLVSGGNAKQAADAFARIVAQAKAQGVSVKELKTAFPQYEDALAGIANQSKLAAGAIDKTTGAMGKQETAADRLKRVVGDLGAMFDKLFGNLTADKAMAGFQASLDDLSRKVVNAKGAFEQNGRALNLNSAAGRDLLGVIDSQAQALADLSNTTLEQTHSQAQARAAWNQGVDALKAQWRQAGLTSAQIEALSKRYGLVPRGVTTTITVTGVQAAKNTLGPYMAMVNNIPRRVTTEVDVTLGRRRAGPLLASGGAVRGPGGPRSDLVPAWLSDGEYVINAMSAARIGMANLNRLNRMSVGGPVPKLAHGGAVAGAGGTTVNNNFTINGALDPEGVARAVRRVLGGHDRRVGAVVAI